MKIKINRDHLATALGQVMAVGGKNPMPILNNALLEATRDRIILRATNLDLVIQCEVKAEVLKPGVITLPLRRLAAIVRELPAVDVAIDVAAGFRAKITSGSSEFQIMGMSAKEFPPTDFDVGTKQGAVNLKQIELVSLLKSVVFAQATDETRYILNGVFFNVRKQKLVLVATDGRRIAQVSKDELADAEDGSMILPAKAVTNILHLMGSGEGAKLAFDDRKAVFRIGMENADWSAGDLIVSANVVVGNYPDYRRAIPLDSHNQVTLQREQLMTVIHRVALVCSEKSNSIRLTFSNTGIEFYAHSSDFGEAKELLATAYAGPEIRIAFNPGFLVDALRNLAHDEVVFDVKDEVSPGVIKAKDTFIAVIMPVRLS